MTDYNRSCLELYFGDIVLLQNWDLGLFLKFISECGLFRPPLAPPPLTGPLIFVLI